MENLELVYNGDFFERIPIENRRKKLIESYTKDEIMQLNKELLEIQKKYEETAPSIIDILKMNVDVSQKQKLLEKLYHYTNADILTSDYTSNLKYLTTNIKGYDDPELHKLEQDIINNSSNFEFSDNYREKILRSNMPFNNKVIAYKRLEVMESYEDSDTSEYAKYKNWMDILLSIPFNKNVETDIDLKRIRETLDKRLSFLEKPKDQIINIVTQMKRNPDFTINAIGIYGVRGTGKSSIVKSISEALGRPYRTVSLGGESDSSSLTGHNFTYVGSCPGRIIEILRETKCTNPIILFDELDKVSETNHGKEIIGNLIHLTDTTTNNKYNYDKYFAGLEFDLSKVLFIFTYNDATKVDRILADRLFKIKVENYTSKEKLAITTTHLIPTVLKEYNLYNESESILSFSEDTINYLVDKSKRDEGMRDIKRKIEIIISRINTLLLTNPDDNIVKLKYKNLYDHYRPEKLPIVIQKDHVDILLAESVTNEDTISEPPFGMYI